ncbi:MAG: TlpA disulfide reductase family protein [Gammaproteobacteria bacterium]|nr:TlpA disulfide reductase family protein [Gammaproteobacteria bacterium]
MIRARRCSPTLANRLLPTAVVALAATTTVAAEPDWRLVEAYLELDEAWHELDREIATADIGSDEKERRRKEERGEHPDIVLAVGAARAIIDSDGKRAVEAAEFLMEHTAGLSPTADRDIEFGTAALAELLGPDWSLVDDFTNPKEGFLARLFAGDPSGPKALAAARAIVGLGGTHERTVDAAEFLVERGAGIRGGSPENVLAGIRALASNVPGYDDWPRMLMHLGRSRGDSPEIDEFLAGRTAEGNDPLVRATARYYTASRLARSINRAGDDERDALRERALKLASGLSAGVEDEEFVAKARDAEGKPTTQTVADAERDILATIRYATVGGTVSDFAGNRLDGVEQGIADFGGQVVLVDFWATWCGPCIAGLPKLRDLVAELPAERFEILSISIDADLESVLDFQEDESMPWAQWHIGVGSELAKVWQVNAIPAYVLIDGQGKILAKGNALTDDFLARLREAVTAVQQEDDPSGTSEDPVVEA